MYCVTADGVILFEADLDKSRIHRGVAGIYRGKIGSDTDVGHDHVQVARRHYFANLIFHLCDVLITQLDARPAGAFDIDHELSGIGAGEIRSAKKREHSKEDSSHAGDNDQRRSSRDA